MPKIDLDGLETHYQITGQGDPLIFIHGLGSSGRDWEQQVEHFSKSYRVVTYDVRGHGLTAKPKGPYSVPMFAADAAALIQALELAPAHIVGLSMGGWIAFQLAVSYPNLLKSMTIINSAPNLPSHTFQQRKAIFQRTVLFRLLSMRKIGEALSGRMFIKPEQEELRQTFIERWAENHKPSYMASFRGAIGWSVMSHVGDIRTPTLVVAADEDYTPLAQKKAYVARMLQAQMAIIEDSRHATPVEKPDEFNRVLSEFLKKVT